MQSARLVSIICLALMLLFLIIHLGVGIGVVARFASYDGLFRPERGLAGYNIFISIVGLILVGFGLFAVLSDRPALGRIVAYSSIALAILTLISLIAALSINSLAINYVTSHFSDKINQYAQDSDAQSVVDKVQTKYTCCGVYSWLDWSQVGLNASATSTGGTTTTTTVSSSGTTSALIITTTPVASTTTATNSNGKRAAIVRRWDAREHTVSRRAAPKIPRAKRQTQSSYGGIVGLPLSFGVTLPQSCCTSAQTASNSLYCVSNANNVTNAFYTVGCGQELSRLSVGQTLGIAVINSFLIMIALATIPALLQTNSPAGIVNSQYVNEAVPPGQPNQYPFGGYNQGPSYQM